MQAEGRNDCESVLFTVTRPKNNTFWDTVLGEDHSVGDEEKKQAGALLRQETTVSTGDFWKAKDNGKRIPHEARIFGLPPLTFAQKPTIELESRSGARHTVSARMSLRQTPTNVLHDFENKPKVSGTESRTVNRSRPNDPISTESTSEHSVAEALCSLSRTTHDASILMNFQQGLQKRNESKADSSSADPTGDIVHEENVGEYDAEVLSPSENLGFVYNQESTEAEASPEIMEDPLATPPQVRLPSFDVPIDFWYNPGIFPEMSEAAFPVGLPIDPGSGGTCGRCVSEPTIPVTHSCHTVGQLPELEKSLVHFSQPSGGECGSPCHRIQKKNLEMDDDLYISQLSLDEVQPDVCGDDMCSPHAASSKSHSLSRDYLERCCSLKDQRIGFLRQNRVATLQKPGDDTSSTTESSPLDSAAQSLSHTIGASSRCTRAGQAVESKGFFQEKFLEELQNARSSAEECTEETDRHVNLPPAWTDAAPLEHLQLGQDFRARRVPLRLSAEYQTKHRFAEPESMDGSADRHSITQFEAIRETKAGFTSHNQEHSSSQCAANGTVFGQIPSPMKRSNLHLCQTNLYERQSKAPKIDFYSEGEVGGVLHQRQHCRVIVPPVQPSQLNAGCSLTSKKKAHFQKISVLNCESSQNRQRTGCVDPQRELSNHQSFFGESSAEYERHAVFGETRQLCSATPHSRGFQRKNAAPSQGKILSSAKDCNGPVLPKNGRSDPHRCPQRKSGRDSHIRARRSRDAGIRTQKLGQSKENVIPKKRSGICKKRSQTHAVSKTCQVQRRKRQPESNGRKISSQLEVKAPCESEYSPPGEHGLEASQSVPLVFPAGLSEDARAEMQLKLYSDRIPHARGAPPTEYDLAVKELIDEGSTLIPDAHGVSRYECRLCTKTFTQRGDLVRHIRVKGMLL